MKKIITCFILSIVLISCKRNIQTNLTLMPKVQINPRANETAQKIKTLNETISVYKENRTIFYYSNGETFQNFSGYTFYIVPYIVEEASLVNRVSMRLSAKSVTNNKNVFKTLTVFDENENKVIFTFNEIKRKIENDDFLITETGDILVNFDQLQILEKFIDSKDIYAVFDGEKKYTFKMSKNLRESFLNIIRKYKLMTSNTNLPS